MRGLWSVVAAAAAAAQALRQGAELLEQGEATQEEPAIAAVHRDVKPGNALPPRPERPKPGGRGRYRDRSGEVFGPWRVIEDAGYSVRPGREQSLTAVWLVEATCCGTQAERSTHFLLRSRNSGNERCQACQRTFSMTLRKFPELPRGVCAWCSRSFAPRECGAGVNECGACVRRAARNGRDPDGRPIRLGLATKTNGRWRTKASAGELCP